MSTMIELQKLDITATHLRHHTIQADGHTEYEGFVYRKYEEKGYNGVVVSGFSDFELQKIQDWLSNQTEDYWSSKIEFFENHDLLVSIERVVRFLDYSLVLWLKTKKQREEFDKFISSISPRNYSVMIEVRDDNDFYEIKYWLEEKEKTANCRVIELSGAHEGFSYDSEVLLITFDNLDDAFECKMRW